MWIKRKKAETAKLVETAPEVVARDTATSTEPAVERTDATVTSAAMAQEPETPVVQTPDQPEGVVVPLDPPPTTLDPVDESSGVKKIVVRMGSSKLEINNIHILNMDINNSILTIDVTESHE